MRTVYVATGTCIHVVTDTCTHVLLCCRLWQLLRRSCSVEPENSGVSPLERHREVRYSCSIGPVCN